jgi:tetraacyldisaccharide 4'-kinase
LDAKKVLSGEDRSLGAGLLRTGLTPLSWLHRVGLEAYLLPYKTGLRKRHRLPVPVVSIGNLTSGGTGKTPMAALVGRLLWESGWRVVLLSRGHGGSHEKEPGAKIVSRGDGAVLLSPEVAGDEPVLLARLLPEVPVLVGRDRRVSGQLAIAEFAPDIVLLDDGLQFWQLHRDLDIVLLDASRPFDNGRVLPRGLLREPPSHLSRAGVVVLTRAERVSPKALEGARNQVRALAPGAHCLTASHTPDGWRDRLGNITAAPEGEEIVAFSGIADGDAFVQGLRAQGLTLKTTVNFTDHHAYNKDGIRALIEHDPSATFVTTEKDLVKVAALWPAPGPRLLAQGLKVVLAGPDQKVLSDALSYLLPR